MQKKLFSVVLLVVMLLATASPALAAGKSISLAEIRFIVGKGYVFLFDLTGKFKESELVGEVTIDYKNYPLSCVIKDDGRAACTGKLGNFTDKPVSGTLAGYAFSATMPEKICNYYDVMVRDAVTGEVQQWGVIGEYRGWLLNLISTNPYYENLVVDEVICREGRPWWWDWN